MSTRRLSVIGVLAMASLLCACASKPKPALQTGPTEPSPQAEPQPAPESQSVRRGSQEDLAASAGDRVFFALDESSLSADAQATLDRQAAWLANNPSVRVVIAGNADERGTREYNLALGARRAAAAQTYLLRRGVSSTRLSTVSYGKERPFDPASSEDAWARNRNAQTVVVDMAGRGW